MILIAMISILSYSHTHAAGGMLPRLRLGETLEGELTAGQDQRGLALFEFDSRESGPLTIEARSLLFDTYLLAWQVGSGGALEHLAQDDNGAGGLNSRLVIEAEAGARYRIELRSAEIPYCGRQFTVQIRRGRSAPHSQAEGARADDTFLNAIDNEAQKNRIPACLIRAVAFRGWSALKMHDLEKAASSADEVTRLARELLGEGHPLEAHGLVLAASFLREKGSYADARPLLVKALSILEARLGSDHVDTGECIGELGVVLMYMGQMEEARPFVERSAEILERHLGAESPDFLTTLNNLAFVQVRVGEDSLALRLHERVLSLREKALGPDHPDVAESLTNLGVALAHAGSYEDAMVMLTRALSIRERALNARDPLIGLSVHNLAWISKLMGRLADAKDLAQRSLTIRQETLGPDHPEVAFNLENLAQIAELLGAYPEARTLYERALAIREKRLEPGHTMIGVSVNNLGVVLMKMGSLTEAHEAFERAAKIYTEQQGAESPLLPNTLGNLADVRSALGANDEARSLYERAVQTSEKVRGPKHPDTALNLGKMGQFLQRMGERDEARAALDRALAIRRETLAEDHPDTGRSWASLGWLLHEAKDPRALDAALSAERIGREHLALTARTLAESKALQYASVRASGMDLALTLAADGGTGDAGTRVWDAVIRSRALVLDEMASRRRALGGGSDPAAVEAAQALRSASSRLANLMFRGPGREPPDRYRGLLDDARRAKEAVEQVLAEKSSAFRQEKAKEKLGLSEVLAELPAKSALVGFSVYSHASKEKPLRSYVAFVGRAGTARPIVVPLGDAEAIDALVSRWRDEAGRGAVNGEAAYRKTGDALRRKIWDPIASHLDDAAMVFIVPDGALSLVSLAALPADNGKYLIEEGPTLHYLSAERDLLAPRALQATGGLLALGGAAFDETPLSDATHVSFRGERSGCGSFATMRFEKLPATTTEVEEISSLWRTNGAPPTTLTGADATEAAFKARAPGHRVLHLATHGFFLDGQCASSMDSTRGVGALVEASPAPAPAQGENPLLLSGLALAGANQRATATPDRDDGILTAEEIATLDLSGVEWAVLSACDTGVGQVKAGEGVFGLRRAFQVAGAATVIMSLWSVEDESARAWMKALYEGRLKKNLGTAEAVRQAGLSLLQHRRAAKLSTHPFYWAGFVAAGEWR